MKLTKYEHACFTLEKEGKLFVVDPGDFTTDFVPSADIVAVFISHEHSDHAGHRLIQSIADASPSAILIGHHDVLETIPIDMKKQKVESGQRINVSSFSLHFFGGEHLQTLPTSPIFPNLGVLVDGIVSYAGDSFAEPPKFPEVLVLPVSGSWMKLSMAYEYFVKLRPSIVVPTHDRILSDSGKAQIDKHLPVWTTAYKYRYTRANPGIEF